VLPIITTVVILPSYRLCMALYWRSHKNGLGTELATCLAESTTACSWGGQARNILIMLCGVDNTLMSWLRTVWEKRTQGLRLWSFLPDANCESWLGDIIHLLIFVDFFDSILSPNAGFSSLYSELKCTSLLRHYEKRVATLIRVSWRYHTAMKPNKKLDPKFGLRTHTRTWFSTASRWDI